MSADHAWSPEIPRDRPPANPISRKRVERVISRAVAGYGVVFGAQTAFAATGQLGGIDPVWATLAVAGVLGSLLASLLASVLARWVLPAHSLVAVVFLLALATWPLAVRDAAQVPAGIPWLYFLLTVATSSAAIGLPPLAATLYLFVVPSLYGVVRTLPAGGSIGWDLATLEAVYAIILGGAVMIIVTMLRQASSSVDAAQATALNRYTAAVRQHATEVERVQVDAIVHDSVLTTLLSAARAYDPEAKALAADMAGRAIWHLTESAENDPDDTTTVPVQVLAERISDAVAALPGRVPVTTRAIRSEVLPVNAAEAIYSATVQAIMNSVQHAGDGADRWVRVHGVPGRGVVVEVGDTGVGFDPTMLPPGRLGVRVSILERVVNAGGRADIDSAPGEGTVVTLLWPGPDGGAAPGPDAALAGLAPDGAGRAVLDAAGVPDRDGATGRPGGAS